MPEWFKGTVLKTVVPETVPWVRIPPSPPLKNQTIWSDFLMLGDSNPRATAKLAQTVEFGVAKALAEVYFEKARAKERSDILLLSQYPTLYTYAL